MNRSIEYESLFNTVYRTYKTAFLRFAFTYVHDYTVAADLTADAFSDFWEKNLLCSEKEAASYILTSIKNKCLNHLKHQRVVDTASISLTEYQKWELHARINQLESCDPTDFFSNEIKQIINETLQSLPARTRQIFIMSRFDGKSYSEIATATNISVKGVEFHISKALKAFRISLKDYFPFFFLFFPFSH